MVAITYDKVCLESEIEFQQLYKLEIEISRNQHGKAVIAGILSEESRAKHCNTDGLIMRIFYFDKDSEVFRPLFSGICNRISYEKTKGIGFAEVELISGTFLLDREKKSRSFQNINSTYQDIVDQVLFDTKKAAFINEVETESIRKPLIQYQETDWQFIRRLASHFHTVIYPDVKTELPRLWFGFPSSSKSIEINESNYIVGISEDYLSTSANSQLFIFYEIELMQDYEIGTLVSFQGRKLRIENKRIRFEQGILVFNYQLRILESIFVEKEYQQNFTGRSLLGTVLMVEGETLKVHLDIDNNQNETEAYPYEWTPDTGSIMYCMPKVGSRVSLYFSEADEQKARVTNCIRENGSSCLGTSDSSKRCLTTEHGKTLFLNPGDIGVKTKNNQLILMDNQFALMESNKKVSIISNQAVKLNGKNILLKTPTEIHMARG